MFEVTDERWREYMSLVSSSWREDDVRHNLSGEVRNRLRQLDRILKHLHTAIDAVTPDPAEVRQQIEWMMACRPRLVSGEMTGDEYMQGLPSFPVPANYTDLWEDVTIFTEAFYIFAWRLVEILNAKGPYKFPELGNVKARAINTVRNQLIQHPEKVKDGQNFTLGLVILSSGPVLRSLGGVIRSESGRTDPLDDSKDRGLYIAAEELRDELVGRFDLAITKVRGTL